MKVISGTTAYGVDCACGASAVVVSDQPAPPKFCPNCGTKEVDDA